jgi:KUP system potassium uptake protein
MLGALGVVYGDIGTSPLYTLKESLHAFHHGSGAVVQPHEVLEVLSLIFWSLMLVVTGKYLVFVLRADNRGEGGIFALLALLPERLRAGSTSALTVPAVLDVVGAALLYGDGAITPAISVLSAVEGLRIARPELGQGSVVLIAVVILIALFRVQKSGTKLLGLLFGPVMAVWFSTLALLGVVWIAKTPVVLQALSPHHAFNYFAHHGVAGMSILGSVVLAVTGGEALYADMGHFGRAPIRRAWLGLVMPALVLSYFGQGALVIANPAAAANPFFAQVPLGGATIALVVLSSVATVIASQALISGAYSLTRQAMQLGFFPRVTVRHTTSEHEGQIYIPELNELLAVACIGLVLAFRESSALAAAYGIAVTGTMAITSVLFALVTHLCFGWSRRRALLIGAVFLCIDLPFLGANLAKVADGGWVPLLAGAIIVVIMLVWHEGRRFLAALNVGRHRPFEEVWPEVERHVACRTPGVGVFMASSDDGVPPVLLHHVKRSRALHRTIVLLTVKTADRPRVELRERLVVEKLHHGFARVIVSYGYMEEPDVPRALKLAAVRRDLDVDLDAVTWYLAREHVVGGPGGQMGELTERLFAFLQNGRR